MNCPMCGFEPVLGRDAGYMDATICQCPQCHHRWIQMGRRGRFQEEQSQALCEWGYNVWIYCLHGLFVWSIFSLIHFLVLVPHPLQSVVEYGVRGAGAVLLLVVIAGVGLGYGLQAALNLTSRLWPAIKTLHILVPLFIAACAGGTYGGILSQLGTGNTWIFEAGITVRSELLSVILGAAFGMLATPIIIVRCSNLRVRKGFRSPLPKPRDPRWDS